MKTLPIGRHEFAAFTENDFLYVDKTEWMYRLLAGGGRYFLSRPRRFGKSLTISTLEAIFQGKKELFKGLWIEDKIGWEKYPVLRFSFDALSSESKSTEALFVTELQNRCKQHGLAIESENIKELTTALIRGLAATTKVVILIDEYDKPILDALPHKLQVAEERRDALKEFFETLKKEDDHIAFIFVTGVTKFAKMSMFSGPNQLRDISMAPEFATLCGYTQEELELHFSEVFPQIAAFRKTTLAQVMQDIKKWYDGYSWLGPHVYCPWSILNMAANRRISNFWFQSGSPSFLLRYLKAGLYFRFPNMTVEETVLESFDLGRVDYRALLFQGGYLTIAGENLLENTYVLAYPNFEVERSLSQFMLAEYSETLPNDASMSALNLRDVLNAGDMEQFKNIINSLFSSIPSQIFLKKFEAYYHSILHLVFTMLGFYVQCEVSTSAGRADAVVTLADRIYIFEFKINGTAKEALAQIQARNYAGKYAASGKTLQLVGVGLDKKSKGISGMEMWKKEDSAPVQ